jgi:hypothetical protein
MCAVIRLFVCTVQGIVCRYISGHYRYINARITIRAQNTEVHFNQNGARCSEIINKFVEG